MPETANNSKPSMDPLLPADGAMKLHIIHYYNTDSVILQQRLQLARMLEAAWMRVLLGSVGMGTNGEEPCTGCGGLGWRSSPCYSLYSLDAWFETYELFTSGIFLYFFQIAVNRR